MMEITVAEMDALIQKMVQKREEIRLHKEIGSKLNAELEAMEYQAALFLKESERESYRSPFGTVYTINRWSVQTPKSDEDKIAFFNYLKERGLDLKYMSVNSNALNSFYNAEMEAAKEQGTIMDFRIPGISEPTLTISTGLRKG